MRAVTIPPIGQGCSEGNRSRISELGTRINPSRSSRLANRLIGGSEYRNKGGNSGADSASDNGGFTGKQTGSNKGADNRDDKRSYRLDVLRRRLERIHGRFTLVTRSQPIGGFRTEPVSEPG